MNEDELAAIGAAVEGALFRMHGVVSSCDGTAEAEIIAPAVERIVAARLAAAWDEGYDEGQADEVRRVYPDIGRRSNPYRAVVVADPADTGR